MNLKEESGWQISWFNLALSIVMLASGFGFIKMAKPEPLGSLIFVMIFLVAFIGIMINIYRHTTRGGDFPFLKH